MDLSKLPKMSDTRRAEQDRQSDPGLAGPTTLDPVPDTDAPNDARALYADYREPGLGLQVYISLALGLIFLLLGLRFGKWAAVTLAGGTFETGATWGMPVDADDPPQGSPVAYWDLVGYTAWTEAAFFIFGAALVLEALAVLATARAGSGLRNVALLAAIAVSALATLLNVGLAIFLMGQGGVPLASLLMAAFGGYITFYLWQVRDNLKHAEPVLG